MEGSIALPATAIWPTAEASHRRAGIRTHHGSKVEDTAGFTPPPPERHITEGSSLIS